MAAWTGLLGSVATIGRPVILPLHPGTRAALTEAGIALPANVVLDRAAGLRHGAGAATPCCRRSHRFGRDPARVGLAGRPVPVLRTTTEWVETVGGAGSSAVLVGLDRDAAVRELLSGTGGRSAELAIERAEPPSS